MTQSNTILDIRGLSKSFPGVQALDDVSFSVERGQIHSIVGENGAGKSTLTKIITGIHERDSGSIMYDGREVDYRTIYGSIQDKIYLVFQELSLCPNLTVGENVFLGKLGLRFPHGHGFVNKRQVFSEAVSHLRELNIDVPVDALTGNLSVAQQQLVEIAKALVIKPKLLVLDEPTSALTEDEVSKLFSLMKWLRDEGVTIILISHIIEDVFSISDTITVLRDGLHVTTRRKDEFSIAEIVRLMVGRDIHQIEIGALEADQELLRLENIATDHLENVSLSLQKGEILGLMGLQGSGNAELLRCIYGKARFRGSVYLEDSHVRIRNSGHAIRNGIVYVPADRKTEGLLNTLDIGHNLSFLSLRDLSTFGLVDSRRVYRKAESIAQQLHLKYSSLDRSPFTLSGGNQQKIVIGKALSTDPRIILLDDPTRGVDIGAKSEIYKIMKEMAATGRGILFLSTELPELLALCHRILVFFNGNIVGEHRRGEATEENLVAEACGLVGSSAAT